MPPRSAARSASTVFARSASAFCHGTAIPWESAA